MWKGEEKGGFSDFSVREKKKEKEEMAALFLT